MNLNLELAKFGLVVKIELTEFIGILKVLELGVVLVEIIGVEVALRKLAWNQL